MAAVGCIQEAEEELAKKEKEVDENIRVQLQLQEDTSATSKDVNERTMALTAAVQARFSLSVLAPCLYRALFCRWRVHAH